MAVRVYPYSFTRRYLPYQGLPLRVCRGGGGVCGVRDFVVPPIHKKGEIRLCSTKPPIHKKSQISFLLGRKKVLQTGGGRV